MEINDENCIDTHGTKYSIEMTNFELGMFGIFQRQRHHQSQNKFQLLVVNVECIEHFTELKCHRFEVVEN